MNSLDFKIIELLLDLKMALCINNIDNIYGINIYTYF